MSHQSRFGFLAILLVCLIVGSSQAQLKFPTASNPGTSPPRGGYGGGWGGYGGGWGGYGGYGGWGGYGYGGRGGFANPLNPFSPYSPFNPISPYSPYNPISPVNNPYMAPYYVSSYIYNPIYNPGLLSSNPRVAFRAWDYANLGAMDVYSYSNLYASSMMNQQAVWNNYYTQAYNQQLLQQTVNQYAQSAQYNQMAQYNALAMAQYALNVTNPYNIQRGGGTVAPAQPAPQAGIPQMTAGITSNYDPYVNAGVPSSYSGSYGKKSGEFEAHMKSAPPPPPPNFSQVQAQQMQERLRQVQISTSPGDIVSGAALNILMDDIRKFPTSNSPLPPITLSEEVLKDINVRGGVGNLGIIRNDGKLTWPVALSYVVRPEDRKLFEETTIRAIDSAAKEKVDAKNLIYMSKLIGDFRTELSSKINDIPTPDYLDAKRFLSELDDAQTALKEPGEWKKQQEYQKYVVGGRNIQDVADYMKKTGMKFGPATRRDEASYRAFHSALLSYDLALNSLIQSQAKE